MNTHTSGPIQFSETPDGILLLDTRNDNSVCILNAYLNRVPPIAHRLLYNNFLSQMERLHLDGFKHIEAKVTHFNDA